MKVKEITAKVVRVISVPPIMALFLLLVMYLFKNGIYVHKMDFIVAIAALVVFPVLAYPVQSIFGDKGENKREEQRKLAFLFCLLGYTGLMMYGIIGNVSPDMKLICITYFLTVVILTIFNKILKIRASGHAASCSSPLVFIVYQFKWYLIFPCAILFAAILWSSLELKRHTMKEFLSGAGICIMSFLISMILVQTI